MAPGSVESVSTVPVALRAARTFSAFVLLLAGLVFGPDVVQQPDKARAGLARITLCHRTKSTTNPYRLISVSVNALNGHRNHTGAVWTASNANGDTWGDIIPGGDADANPFWVDADGSKQGSKALNWSTTGKTFMVSGGANTAKCARMSAQKFYEIMKAANQTDTQIAADLEDQAANEDRALRPASGWTASNVASSVGAISIRTNAPSAIGATSATLSGTIEAGSTSTTPKFEYGTTTSLGTTVSGGSAATGTIAASASLSGLATSTTYYYRVIGEIGNEDTLGTYYGEIKSFTTGKSLRTVALAVDGDSDGSVTMSISSTAALITALTPSSSAGTTTYTVLSGSLTCSISGSTLTTSSTPGTCKLEAVDGGDSTYSAATSSVVTVTVNDGTARNLNLSGNVASYLFNATPPTMVASPVLQSDNTTAATGGAITFFSSTTSVCTINSGSGLVAFVNTGTCSVYATIAASSPYASATSATTSFTVTANARNLNLSGNNASYVFTATPPTIVASPVLQSNNSSAPGGTTTFSTNAASICTIDSATGVVTFVDAGTCSIGASITADGANAGATATAVTFTITAASRTLTLAGHAATYVRNDTPPTMTATPSTGAGDKTFSSSTTSVCTINSSSGVVTFVDTGTCTLSAAIDAFEGYAAATATSISFTVTSPGGGGGGGGGGTTTTVAAATTTTTQAPRRITICHATGSATNPYVAITVDANGLNGHGDHAGDIIPAPAGGCSARVIARASASTTTTRVPRRISICHATGSATNPYVEITVDVEGLNGHGDHEGDIIPAPAGGCSTQAINAQRVTTTTAPRRVTICHATGSATNPYVEITVDANGLNGHGDHDGDIIPAPAGGCPSRLLRDSQRVTPSTTPRRITICHATGSATNPYVEITVDANSLSGHGDHPGDIIPAPAGGCGINNVLRTIVTTTTLPAGSLGRTQQQVNDTRNGGQNQIIANNLQISGTPTPEPRGGNGGGNTGGGGGTITLQPRLNSPSPQLLNVRTSDPRIRVTVRSSGSNYNQPSTWVNEGFGSYCWKIEPFADGDYTYVLPNPSAPPDPTYAGLPYSAVIVKAGSVVESDPAYQANTVFMNPAAGSTVFADVNKNGISDPGGQGGGLLGDKSISHIVLCVGESEFPEIAVTTTSTTVAGGSGTTTTTIAGGSGTTTTTTTTTIAGGSTTTTVAGGSTTSTTSTTVAGGSTTTTVAGGSGTTTTTTTIAPGASTPTTTSPGATPTTLPEGTPPSAPPPLEILVSAPPGVPLPPRLDLELFLTTGTANERLVLTVFTDDFEIPEPYSAPPLLELPETGVTRWTDRQMYGFALIAFGFGLLMFGATRRLRRR